MCWGLNQSVIWRLRLVGQAISAALQYLIMILFSHTFYIVHSVVHNDLVLYHSVMVLGCCLFVPGCYCRS